MSHCTIWTKSLYFTPVCGNFCPFIHKSIFEVLAHNCHSSSSNRCWALCSNPTTPLWDLLCALRQRHARKGCSSKCYHTAENREFNKPWPAVALDHTEKYDLTRHITQLLHCPVASCFIPPQMLIQDCIRLVCSCSAMETHSWSSSHTENV